MMKLIGRPHSPGSLHALLREVDNDGSGCLDYAEFLNLIRIDVLTHGGGGKQPARPVYCNTGIKHTPLLAYRGDAVIDVA